jgi:hypothetical protein
MQTGGGGGMGKGSTLESPVAWISFSICASFIYLFIRNVMLVTRKLLHINTGPPIEVRLATKVTEMHVCCSLAELLNSNLSTRFSNSYYPNKWPFDLTSLITFHDIRRSKCWQSIISTSSSLSIYITFLPVTYYKGIICVGDKIV